MSIKSQIDMNSQIEHQLNQLASPAAAPGDVSLALPTGQLRCRIAACDSIGCSVEQVRLTLADVQRRPLDRMRALADELCKQLRYLVEPLQVIEVDSEQPLVQARSQPPSRDAGKNAHYYELLVGPGELTLARFSAPRGQPRQSVPMQLTREVLLRLLGDLASAVSTR